LIARGLLQRVRVLLRCASVFLVVALAGACQTASVDVLDPLPTSPAEPEAGAFDAMTPGDATIDGSLQDASSEADAPPGAMEGGECDRAPNGARCETSGACCSGLCALDPTSKLTCRPANGCLGVGGPCGFAGACCSLACTSTGGAATCGASPLCVPAGGSCASADDCCADQCVAGKCIATSASCKPAGETCAGNPDCCGRVCSTAGDGQQRCALLQGCRAQGEICASPADCCSSTCAFDANAVGHCAALPSCMTNDTKACASQVDDVCAGNDDCCSRQCLPTSDGTTRCVAAGGCRTQCELCASSADCCSGSCVSISASVSICQASGACGKDGEGCMANPQCCAVGPGLGCVENPPAGGFHRCHSQPVSPDGGAADGLACALPDECSSGLCLPQSGPLQCSASCVADGFACTDRADCCDPFADCMNEQGSLVCAPLIH